MKKHIVRYNRLPANAATRAPSAPSAPARAPSATLIHAAMTEAPDEAVFERPHRLLRPARLGARAEMKLSFTARLSQRATLRD